MAEGKPVEEVAGSGVSSSSSAWDAVRTCQPAPAELHALAPEEQVRWVDGGAVLVGWPSAQKLVDHGGSGGVSRTLVDTTRSRRPTLSSSKTKRRGQLAPSPCAWSTSSHPSRMLIAVFHFAARPGTLLMRRLEADLKHNCRRPTTCSTRTNACRSSSRVTMGLATSTKRRVRQLPTSSSRDRRANRSRSPSRPPRRTRPPTARYRVNRRDRRTRLS